MAGFRDLGLEEDVCAVLESSGIRAPYAFQAEAIPVLLRGTSAASIAAPGSGKTLAYAPALLARLDAASPATQLLVLRPSDDQVSATALCLHRLGRPRDLVATALRPDRLEDTASGRIVAGSPRATLDAIQSARLKLDACRAIVVDGLSEMLDWGAEPALETIASVVPKDAQRVVFTARWSPEIRGWLERHARRARQLGAGGTGGIPAAAAAIGAPELSAPDLSAEIAVEPRERWSDLLTAALSGARRKGIERAILFCRTEAAAGAAADALRVRGVDIAAEPFASGVHVVWNLAADVAGAFSASCGSPPDAGTLRRRVEGSARALLLVPPAEQVHVAAAAEHARVRLEPARIPLPTESTRAIEEFRTRLRAAATERDLAPYHLLLDPLFAELGPTTVAAAAAALLRERAPERPEPAKVPAWTRLYLAVGKKDNVRPADLVGCIAGESGIAGAQVGRIDLRDTFSVVEVDAEVAERVLRSLTNATVRGRPVNARPFRGH